MPVLSRSFNCRKVITRSECRRNPETCACHVSWHFAPPPPGKNGATRPALDRVCGPATFTEAVVQDVRANGAPTGISYLMAAANLAAARIEEAARIGEGVVVQTKMAKTPSDINVRIPEWAMRYITDNKRKIDARGPVFLTVRAEIWE